MTASTGAPLSTSSFPICLHTVKHHGVQSRQSFKSLNNNNLDVCERKPIRNL
jgi:hypothetical protein